MAADETTVKEMVTEILNASASGSFSTTIDTNNYSRVADQITESVRSAALMIASEIVANPSHPHRNLFVGAAQSLTHGGEMPDMAAEGDLIEIKRWSGGSFEAGMPEDVQKINDYRNNINQIYQTVAHDDEASRLSGFYAVANGRFYFTGDAAQGYFPVIARGTVGTLIADQYEPVWIALGVGCLTLKEGDNLLPVAQYYLNFGMSELSRVRNNEIIRRLPPVAQARRAREGA